MKRSRLEMKFAILKSVASEPIRPTRLLGIANISFTNMERLLPDLEGHGFLRIEQLYRKRTGTPYGRMVHITDEGKKVLNEYESVAKKLENS